MAVHRRLAAHLTIRPPLTREDLPGLYARVCAQLERDDPVIVFCDVGAYPEPDAVIVDALARLQLAARHHGCQVRLCHSAPALRSLVELMGLTDVFSFDP
jgi:ABC-type transporter Mla MlaB component